MEPEILSAKVGAPEGAPGPLPLDFTKSRDQLVIIESIRIGFLFSTLAIVVGFQALQVEFLNVDWLLPIYIMMSVVFLANSTYLLIFEQSLRGWFATASLFVLDAFYVTGLIYFTGLNQSIFLFLYLVNIILCGFVFQRRGAVLLAFLTSTLFSFLIIVGPELRGQALFFTAGLNNLAFISVAVLSGMLSEQLNFMGSELLAKGRDLRVLRDLNKLIIDNIATGIVTADKGGKVLQVNQGASSLLELSQETLHKLPLDEIFPGILQKIESSQSWTDSVLKFDMTLSLDGVNRQTFGVTVSRLPMDSQESGYILTFEDLTKIRKLEFAMRQGEKMAAIGQLAAGIAHEIRNPLASISGSIQMLGASFKKVEIGGEPSEESKLMNIVLREIDRLNNLISEFLDFVRPDAQKNDPMDLNHIIREILDMAKMSKNLRPDIEQVVELKSSKKTYGNSDKMRQAFLNIIINAYQAMKDSTSPRIRVSTEDRENVVLVKISDSGCGIDERNLKKIFEPFHTTKPKGTGLGLAVTHKIIENHGGRIFVESVSGQGTEFTIELPVREADKLSLADSKQASDDFAKAFRGQKRGSG